MPSGRGRSRRRGSSGRGRRAARDGVVVLEVAEGLDRHAVEALALEIRRLARRLGLEVKALQVETTEEPSA